MEATVDFYSDFFEGRIDKSKITEIVQNNSPEQVFPILNQCLSTQPHSPEPEAQSPDPDAPLESRIIVDLHTFNRLSAEQYVRRVLMSLDAGTTYSIVFIVGQGHHSEAEAVIPKIVESVCECLGFKKQHDAVNKGKIIVTVERLTKGDCAHHYLSKRNLRAAGSRMYRDG